MKYIVAAGLFGSLTFAWAQTEPIRLWPGVAPGSEGWTRKEVRFQDMASGGETIRNVVEPALTPYLPPRSLANGTAIIVSPGGAFQILSWQKEGTDIALWLNKLGVTAFVLKYRLADTGATDAEFRQVMASVSKKLLADPAAEVAALSGAGAVGAADGRRAVRLVREGAKHWGINPDRIGMIGFSAGASVSLDVELKHEAIERPNFVAFIYGPSLRGAPVPPDAAPIFLACASDDPILPSTDSLEVYTAWKKAGHPAELHVYTKGGHGFGMMQRGLPVDHWVDQFRDWMRDQGLLAETR